MQKPIIVIFILSIIFNSCASKQPVIIDTGNIEQLRYEYQYLREQFDKLQSDYKQLAERSELYAKYYQNSTERIAEGARELDAINTSNAKEIAKLREYVKILRNIINDIISGQSEFEAGEQ